jgi:hypothetical protein
MWQAQMFMLILLVYCIDQQLVQLLETVVAVVQAEQTEAVEVRELRVHQVAVERVVLLEQLVQRELLDRLDLLVAVEVRELRVHQVAVERVVLLEQLVQRELLEVVVALALLVHLEQALLLLPQTTRLYIKIQRVHSQVRQI